MNPSPLYEKSTLALANRSLAHLRDFRLLKLDGVPLDEGTRLRLGQHLADMAEKFLAALPSPAPRGAGVSGGAAPCRRVPPAVR